VIFIASPKLLPSLQISRIKKTLVFRAEVHSRFSFGPPVVRIKLSPNLFALVDFRSLVLDRDVNGVPYIVVMQVEDHLVESASICVGVDGINALVAQVPRLHPNVLDRLPILVPHIA
jgi:hypothetical protein